MFSTLVNTLPASLMLVINHKCKCFPQSSFNNYSTVATVNMRRLISQAMFNYLPQVLIASSFSSSKATTAIAKAFHLSAKFVPTQPQRSTTEPILVPRKQRLQLLVFSQQHMGDCIHKRRWPCQLLVATALAYIALRLATVVLSQAVFRADTSR